MIHLAALDRSIAMIIALGGITLIASGIVLMRWRTRERARERMWAEDEAIAVHQNEDLAQKGFLGRWLFLAGFREPAASAGFVLATVICAVIGLGVAIAAYSSGFTGQAVRAAENIPGGVGDLAKPILIGGPWILLVLLAMVPWIIVNARRKKVVRQVDQDLPVTLELLATMSESGLAFDTALGKVLDSSELERPLFQELRTFQLESLGGISRVQCFRRLARRIEVPSMSIFVSALVQAEQVGAGFTRVLRIQADDLRNRRREDANMLAESLTVKLVFPLVLCFLPAIFVATLGPVFLQFVQLTESLTQSR